MTFDPKLSALCELVWQRLTDATEGRSFATQKNHDWPTVWGIAVVLYRPGRQRLIVVRRRQSTVAEAIDSVVNRILAHPRFAEFGPLSSDSLRFQMDVISDEPQPVEFESFRENDLGPNRFEYGVDGLRIVGTAKTQYFLPGDAFVKSVLGLEQLRRAVERMFPGEKFSTLKFSRFRSRSFLRFEGRWLPLYRGIPVLGEDVTAADLWGRALAAVERVVRTQAADGQFEYYYDAKTDSQVNHEHPHRDPVTDPFYNFVRHCGGILTLLFYEAARRDERLRWTGLVGDDAPIAVSSRSRESSDRSLTTSTSATIQTDGQQHDGQECPSYGVRRAIVTAIECYLRTMVEYVTADGFEAGYSVDNRKGKLGGSGLGLYSLALYQHLFADYRFENSARRLANHLLAEIHESGEFQYYHTYLNRQVSRAENARLFSFYYPGEALGGLAAYLKYVCREEAERERIVERVHRALRFLIRERPTRYTAHFAPLPSDAWLMMAINELWDEPGFQRDEYRQFVFGDADAMCDHQYMPKNALYSDYIGSFYYHYGDHPYPDGARAEGLTAAYLLAVKVGDTPQAKRYFKALVRIAWACLRLCNTRASLYSVPNPEHALGSIRFKLTRQWVRVDTTEHVASFFLKFLPYFVLEATSAP